MSDKVNYTAEEIRKLRSGKLIPANNGATWTDDAIEELKRLFYAGVGITDISYALQRTERSVILKMSELFLFTINGGRYPPDRTRCLCRMCKSPKEQCPKFNPQAVCPESK